MKDIRFYNFEGRLLAVAHDVITVSWRICYNDIGSFEGHFSLHSPFVSELSKEPWLVAVQGDLQAVITGRQLGKEFILYGRTPNWLLTKRVICPFVTSDYFQTEGGTVPNIINWIFSQAYDENDPVILEKEEGNFSGDNVSFWRNTAHPAFEIIRDCAERDRSGHRLWFEPNTGMWHFQLYKGAESGLLLSEDSRNAYETEVTEDVLSLATCGWYGCETISKGDYNPITNQPVLKNMVPENFAKYYKIQTSGTRFGLTMKAGQYLFCDSSDGTWRLAEEEEIQKTDCVWVCLEKEKNATGIYRWEEILDATGESGASSELLQKERFREITLMTKGLEYGTDYALGDVVRVQKSVAGIQMMQKKRVTAVNIWYENGNSGQQPELSEQ